MGFEPKDFLVGFAPGLVTGGLFLGGGDPAFTFPGAVFSRGKVVVVFSDSMGVLIG